MDPTTTQYGQAELVAVEELARTMDAQIRGDRDVKPSLDLRIAEDFRDGHDAGRLAQHRQVLLDPDLYEPPG